jgi:hypothetical protein
MTKKFFVPLFLCVFLSGCAISNQNEDIKTTDEGSIVPTEKNEVSTEGYSINLTSPNKDQVLKSPFLVGGVANVPLDIVYVRVKKTNGEVVISEQTKVKKATNEKSGSFAVLINFVFKSTDHGIVEVYGIDEKTKQEVVLKSVEVNFDITSSGNIKNADQ